jgi:peptidoglycan/LPS O-acetylase OafA/YrhL
VSLVLLSHLCGTKNFPATTSSHLIDLGILGVRVFFVISGYLITGILLSDLVKTGDINLRRFYLRRTLRLFPAAWVFITTAAVLSGCGLIALHRYDLFFAYSYTINYYEGRSFSIGHLWSLAVEEQFYLIWPVTLKMLGQRRSRSFLIALMLLAPFCRLLSVTFIPAFNFLMYSDALGTGCLLAVLQKDLATNRRYQNLLSSRWIAVMPFIALAANYIPSTKLSWLLGETIQNLSIVLCVHWSILNPTVAVGRFLNLRIITTMGILSYSLYLWQQLFSQFGIASGLATFPLNLAMMFLAALASYFLVEQPFLRLRTRLEAYWWPPQG